MRAKSSSDFSAGFALLWVGSLLSTLLVIAGVFQLLQFFQGMVALLLVVLVLIYLLLGPVGFIERRLILVYTMAVKGCPGKYKGPGRFLARLRSPLLHGPWLNARMIAVVSVYVTAFALLALCGWLLVPVLQEQGASLLHHLPHYAGHARALLLALANTGNDWFGRNVISDMLHTWAQNLAPAFPATSASSSSLSVGLENGLESGFNRGASVLLEKLPEWVGSLFAGLLYLLSGLILTFYGLLDGPKLLQRVLPLFPQHYRPHLRSTLERVHQTLLAFIRGQLLLALCSGLLMLVLYLVFHVKYAVLLSTLFTVAEVIPVIGPWFAFFPGLVVMLFGPNPWVALYILALYAIVKDNILLPNVVGNAMGLHPVVVILALLLSAKLAGWVGLVLAIPATSLLSIMLKSNQETP